MKTQLKLIPILLLGLLASACDPQPTTPKVTPADESEPLAQRAGAPLFEGMGDHQHPITTGNPDAQRYFDQGLTLAFGFNHAESVRSFKAAQTLDPNCAMCFWGEALARGPNINVTSNGKAIMAPEERKAAYAALQKAIALKGQASQLEQGYIDALATRYNGDPDTDRAPLDLAYAEAMGQLAAQYPDDEDAAVLYAEALMNTMPWNYWADDGNPKPATQQVIASLERIMAKNPKHPLALHLYIHAVEASSNPGRAEVASDTLADLVPGSGHLVHMPAHIYWRIGRYHDASEANVKAAAVDEAYISQCNAQGFYPALYYPHNIHFLWAASAMEGRSQVSIEAARKVAANIRLEQIEQFPAVEFFHTIPLLALTQFGQWQALLEEPQPPQSLDFSNAIWHYTRAVAQANLGNLDAARQEHQQLVPLKKTAKIMQLDGVDYPASSLLDIADHLVQGEIAYADNDLNSAIGHFEQAVAMQDALPYTEPPFWYYPTRQSLGAALLKAEKFAEAEAVYRQDLRDYPRNGWSLSGLAASLKGQGKQAEAEQVQAKLDTVWQFADVTLNGSRI